MLTSDRHHERRRARTGARRRSRPRHAPRSLRCKTVDLEVPAEPYMVKAKEIWEKLGLPRLTPQLPWHGYELGDWDALWTQFAERAVAGDWEENGKQTFERRKGGMKPETPVREIER